MAFRDGETIRGWGVISPDGAVWHLAGMFDDRKAAQIKAQQLGNGYRVRFGENQKGTDNFISVEQG